MAQNTQAVEGTREGSRWVNLRPSPDEFAQWFKENVPIDDRLDAEHYIGGIVLIPAEEKVKEVTGLSSEGEVLIRQRTQLTFTPYSKVDARLKYFWDLMGAHKDEWHGVSAPVDQDHVDQKDDSIGRINRMLPKGFFILPVPHDAGYQYFVCCTWRIAIYERPITYEEIETETIGSRTVERVIAQPPIVEGIGTKMIPMIASAFKRGGARGERVFYPDPTSLMKAETGAKGRALGMAGIFVVPGSGVATAEDMYEALGEVTEPAPEPQPPPTPGTQPEPAQEAPQAPQALETGAETAERTRDQMITAVREKLKVMSTDFPGKYEEFTTWARSTRPPVRDVTDLSDARLRGVVKRVERLLDEALRSQKEREVSVGNEGHTEAGGQEPEADPTKAPATPEGESGGEPG
jgi:hypothetical protein